MEDFDIFETEIFPYLEGEVLKGDTITLTMKGIKPEKMKDHAGEDKTKRVLYFEETVKGFVLNKTNTMRIIEMYGRRTGKWGGCKITLYTERVKVYGQTHNALRVAPGIPDGVEWLDYNPTKTQFFGRAKADLGLEPAGAASILKMAGFTNGYKAAEARDMWTALEAGSGEPEPSAMDDIEADDIEATGDMSRTDSPSPLPDTDGVEI